MKPLIVLLSVFVLSLVATKIFRGNFEYAFPGRMAMAVMLVFTGTAHFIYTNGMTMMLPGVVPYKTLVIYLTGIIEIIAAIGLFIPAYRVMVGWLLIAFFILLLPANIYASLKQVNYQKATLDGPGLTYLWFRVPLQFLFIAWTYFFAIRE